MVKHFYAILAFCAGEMLPTKEMLTATFDASLVDYAIEKGYIDVYCHNDRKEELYKITKKGQEARG